VGEVYDASSVGEGFDAKMVDTMTAQSLRRLAGSSVLERCHG
jgi:hypothetical protein